MKKGMFIVFVSVGLISLLFCVNIIQATELILQPDATSGKDAMLVSGTPNQNYGIDTTIDVKSASGNRRALIEFNLSGISSSAVISNATLYLYAENVANVQNESIAVYRLTQSWTEIGVTWNKYDGITGWLTAGGDFSSNIMSLINVSTEKKDYAWDITSLVQGWVNESYENYGLIVMDILDGANQKSLTSSDGTNSTNHPKLAITYIEDMVSPNLTIISPTNKNYTTSSVLVNISAQDANLQSIWFYSGGANITYTPPVYYNFSQGTNTLMAYANDSLGNLNSSSVTFYVDSLVPLLSIVSPQNGSTYGTNTSLQLNYTVNDVNLQSCWWNIDSGGNNSIVCGQNTTFDASGGLHTISIYANDSYGLQSSSSSSFNINVGAPTISNLNPGDVYLNYSLVNFSYYASDIDLQACELWGDFDGIWKLNQTNLNPKNYSYNNFTLNLTDGSYKWNIRCNDTQGHSSFNGNKTFVIDTIIPNLILSEPSGTKSSRSVSASWNVDDLNINSCIYNVYRGVNLEIANTSVNCLTDSATFSVTVDADFTFNFYANDFAGNANYASSSFRVSTSGGGGDTTGGGGGGGGTTHNLLNTTLGLNLDKLNDLLGESGDDKKIMLNVKNTGTGFLNDCQLKGYGDYSSWISGGGVKDLSAGQEYEYSFNVKIPENISGGKYLLGVLLSCKEINKSSFFSVEVIEKQINFELIKVERISNNGVRVSYSLEELSGLNQDIDIQFLLFGPNKEKVAEFRETKAISANSKQNFESLIPIDSSLEGDLSLLINLNSKTYSTFVEENIVLGKMPIGGFAIFGNARSPDNLFTGLLILFFVIFAFFIIRRIFSHKTDIKIKKAIKKLKKSSKRK
jgi:hypothetical protein